MNAEEGSVGSGAGRENEEFIKARESARDAYRKFQEARLHLQSAALNAGVDFKECASEFVEGKVDSISHKGRDAYHEASEYITSHPLRSAGTAFLAGFIVSKLMK